mgnify:FL=1
MTPQNLTTPEAQAMARHIRDGQWVFMRRVAEWGTLWWCCWNKRGLPEAADESRMSLLSGMQLGAWLQTHPEWWDIGAWEEGRYAQPVRLTPAGHAALAEYARYDREPVSGGLVEPGWIAVPIDAKDALRQTSAGIQQEEKAMAL